MSNETLYQHASVQMRAIIDKMIVLSEEAVNFNSPTDTHWADADKTTILLCGKGYTINEIPNDIPSRKNAWLARSALSFGIERAATGLLYRNIQPFIDHLVSNAFSQTKNFTSVSEEWIYKNPQFLPVLMHAIGAFSKRDLQKEIGTGTASDTGISKPVCKKLASLIDSVDKASIPNQMQIKERIKATTEG